MATTNKKRPTTPAPRTHEGAIAHRIGKESQLRRSVMACLLGEKEFYEDGTTIADRIAEGVADVPIEVAAEIAIEARERMNLRHAPLWIVREMARRGGRVVGDTLARVIQRPDELTEFVAMCFATGMKKGLTPQIKRGLAEAFQKFDEYQLGKYDRDGREVRLRDVLFLSHPKPKDEEQEALWKRLVDGDLAVPNTWETRLSSGEDKEAVWNDLIETNALGGMAVLRNLRNMEKAGIDRDRIRKAIGQASYKRVLPFRFLAAARYAPSLEPELEAAMFRSTEGLKKLPGRTALVVDHSGSMTALLSERSEMMRFDAAAGVAVLLREIADDVDIYAYTDKGARAGRYASYGGSEFEIINTGNKPSVAKVPARRGFALRDALYEATDWWGTDTRAGVAMAQRDGYDRIVVITDEQSRTSIPNPLEGTEAYVVNVASARNGIGYGRWNHVDGFSDNVIRWIHEFENLQR